MQEIDVKGRDLAKAGNSANASTTIISILNDLRENVQATEELLRRTRIGLIVGRLRTNPDKVIQRQATELVGKWKAVVRPKGSSGASTPKPRPNGAASPLPPSTASPTTTSATKGKAKLTVPKEQRNAKTDGIKWELTGNATRNAWLKAMYDGLAFMSEEGRRVSHAGTVMVALIQSIDATDLVKVAQAVEQAAFDKYQPETSETYRNKMRSLFQNLKNKSNPELRIRVFNGTIKPEDFVAFTHEQLKSSDRKAEDERIMKENMDKAMVPQEERSISTHLTCGKCGQSKVR